MPHPLKGSYLVNINLESGHENGCSVHVLTFVKKVYFLPSVCLSLCLHICSTNCERILVKGRERRKMRLRFRKYFPVCSTLQNRALAIGTFNCRMWSCHMHSMYGSYRSGPEVLFQDLRRDEIRGWWWWMMMIVAQRANRYIVVFHFISRYRMIFTYHVAVVKRRRRWAH